MGETTKLSHISVNRPEESRSAAHLVSDDKTPFTIAFKLEYFHDRAIAALYLPHDILVHI
jgi:hypothetical protein